MKYKSINCVTNYLTNIINNECNTMLKKISEDFNLNEKKLKELYFGNSEKSIISNNKKKIKHIVDSNIRCLGIIKSGAQCARTRKYGYDYCRIHQKTLKFGKKLI